MAPTHRLLLLCPTRAYKTADFLRAADALKLPLEVVVATDERSSVEALSGGGLMTVPMDDEARALEAIAAAHARRPFDAIVAVDARYSVVAASACRALGLRSNDPEAVRRAGDKRATRRALAAAGLPGPRFVDLDRNDDPAACLDRVVEAVGLPCVLKPLGLSGSRGVMRADDGPQFVAAFLRLRRLLASLDPDPLHHRILVESYMDGQEVAVEGLMRGGDLEILAIFDKPDPLVGPFFEETIYVTPSRHPQALQQAIGACAAQAAWALGLTEGPIHAEVRLCQDGPKALEVAARSIGGLCARTLVFASGAGLEEIILRHALGLDTPLEVDTRAAGVMMIPIPGAGLLKSTDATEARQVPGIEDVIITHALSVIRPLPEGDSYLGFILARGEEPAEVEDALRKAHGSLSVVIVDDPARCEDQQAPQGLKPTSRT